MMITPRFDAVVVRLWDVACPTRLTTATLSDAGSHSSSRWPQMCSSRTVSFS